MARRNKDTAKLYEERKQFDKAVETIEREVSNKSKGSKGKSDTDFRRNEHRRGANDVRWYTPDVGMLNDAARFPWLYQLGQSIKRRSKFYNALVSDNAVPGAAMMSLNMVYGVCNEPEDPLNVAAQAIYTYVRHINSGSKNYGVPDLMIYIMSLDAIYYMISWITRIYATINMFAMENKYLPEALLALQNIDVESIRKDLPGFRSRINNLIMKIGNLLIPNTMPIFERHSFLFNNYYMEGDDIRDQIYFFNPNNYYVFGYDNEGKGMLKYKQITPASGTKLTADDLVRMVSEMVNAIYMEEDFGIMAGDILKAYGDANVQKIGLIPDQLIVAQPVYNYTVLNQFRNARMYPIPDYPMNVTQIIPEDRSQSPYLQQSFAASASAFFMGYLITDGGTYSRFHNVATVSQPYGVYEAASRQAIIEATAPDWLFSDNWDVTPDEVMVGTRLTVGAGDLSLDPEGDVVEVLNLNYGTELPTSVKYAYNKAGSSAVPCMLELATFNVHEGFKRDFIKETDNAGFLSLNDVYGLLAPFKYHPLHHVWWTEELSGERFVRGMSEHPNMGIDNYAIIDDVHLERLHTVALLGEYAVPRLAVSK